jgi:hypothetical protein
LSVRRRIRQRVDHCLSVDEFASELTDCLFVDDDDDDDDDLSLNYHTTYRVFAPVLDSTCMLDSTGVRHCAGAILHMVSNLLYVPPVVIRQ